MKEKTLALGLVLVLGIFLTLGCVGGAPGNVTEEQGTDTDTGTGTGETPDAGTETYTGTWEGTWIAGMQVEGTFELTIDYDEGTATGSFSGDAGGALSGSISEGTLDASGEASGYYVTWSGSVSGNSISGTWESSEVSGSGGTWEGTISETETSDEEDTETDTEEESEEGMSLAESIGFSIDMEGPNFEEKRTSHYKARGIGTDETEIHLEIVDQGKFILSEKMEKGWVKVEESDEWYGFSSLPGYDFEDYWDQYSTSLSSYVEYLEGWESGEYTYTDERGNTLTFYDIQMNPTLEDDLFDEPDNVEVPDQIM